MFGKAAVPVTIAVLRAVPAFGLNVPLVASGSNITMITGGIKVLPKQLYEPEVHVSVR